MADRLALFSGRSDKPVIFYVTKTGNCQKSCGPLGFNSPKDIILTLATVPVLWNEARVGGQCGGEIWNYELHILYQMS